MYEYGFVMPGRPSNPTWLNLVFKSTADFGEGVVEVVG